MSCSRVAAAYALSLVSACHQATEAPIQVAAPIVQGGKLQFPANHPQLASLVVTDALPSKALVVDLPAKLVWNESRTQRVYAAFAGRVTRINADVGQQVTGGAVLAQLASPDFGVAQADTAKALADVRLTERSLQRQKELLEAGIIARKELEQSEAEAARAQAELSRAQARTRLYGSASGVNQQLQLTAGLGGIVVERNLNPGQEVRPDQSGPGVPPLFVITDPTQLWVQIDARESEAGTLRPGVSFSLLVPAMPGKSFDGTVIAAADFIDPSTRTIKIRGLVSNTDRTLKAEMLATARVERHLGPGVLLPAQAALLLGSKHYVFVRVAPSTFERREVELGFQGPREVVVSKGLEVGEQVVSENALLLARQLRLASEDVKPGSKP
jgi:membrane fusion protein, heavy metal efflux system